MKKRRPGTRLPCALRESWPRWIHFSFVSFWTAILLAPIAYFLYQLYHDPKPYELSCIEPVMGILGVVALVDLLRTTILWIMVGDTIVEISREPACVGDPLEYFILQHRHPPGVRSMEARFMLRRHIGPRTYSEIALSIPLAAATLEPGGRRKIEGSLVVPDVPPQSPSGHAHKSVWFIEVKIAFKGGSVHTEENPFAVEATKYGE